MATLLSMSCIGGMSSQNRETYSFDRRDAIQQQLEEDTERMLSKATTEV